MESFSEPPDSADYPMNGLDLMASQFDPNIVLENISSTYPIEALLLLLYLLLLNLKLLHLLLLLIQHLLLLEMLLLLILRLHLKVHLLLLLLLNSLLVVVVVGWRWKDGRSCGGGCSLLWWSRLTQLKGQHESLLTQLHKLHILT